MKFLVYSEITAARIAVSLGLPEYSYYFVLRDFMPVLQELGDVQVIERPEVEVDRLYDEACAAGERCLFLSFSPPQKTPLNLRCPTIPVFAWEFDSIPNEHWLDELSQDWRYVLEKCGRGITHSGLTVQAVKAEMGESFPVISIPSPVWDKYQSLREQPAVQPLQQGMRIRVRSGVVLDTHDVALEPYMPGPDAVAKAVAAARTREQTDSPPAAQTATQVIQPSRQQSRLQISRRYLGEWYLRVLRELLPWLPDPAQLAAPTAVELVIESDDKRLEPRNPVEPSSLPKSGVNPRTPQWVLNECSFELSGVVFTALFNPYDGRKNWVDMLTAFCAAFKDTADATLVFKLGHHEYQSALNDMLMCMARMPKFKCRVVLLQGFLEKAEFDSLIRASAFVVNASHGEGQCLPLMEFLSCGKPAIAPRHSAMLDYIDSEVAFVVDSWLDATAWSHDPRLAYRTCRHQIDWASLVRAYCAAYQCVRNEPSRYTQMSAAAIERMRGHCSQAVAMTRLEDFLNLDEALSQ
ncbi:glycosyltransferase [Pseudomonas sp. 2FG]|uniref:glycosyltransferase n=1 Tax=Pseudomonas sp. 2FG TaxID=2502191 RepID=UPI0010F4F412|nr:glycosyltransferase [Pseudomonas sp. 2FG]